MLWKKKEYLTGVENSGRGAKAGKQVTVSE